ncbi:MAG: hypothetical protein WBC63_03640 [Candidatus Bipolaricaulia bacterium]
MELDQWLIVYQALSQSAATKEHSGWSLFIGGLVAESILVISLVFLVSIEPIPLDGLPFFVEIGLIAVGLLSSASWLVAHTRLKAEERHLGAMLRGIESQFAGGEFHRNLHRFCNGEKVCVAASNWTCDEWLPSISRLPLVARLAPRFLAGLVALSFLLGWIALLIRAVVS